MNRNDWQEAFGPTPDAFRNRVDATLNRLEEREMRRSIKFSTALAAAMLALALLAGAAFAAARLDIWESLQYADPIIPLEGADELVVTDLATAETNYFRVFVQEGVYDGYSAIVKLHVEPKNPEKYAIITDFAMIGDVGDEYISEVVKEYEGGIKEERIVGRKDGKEIIFLSTPRLLIDGEISSADAFGVENLFNSFLDQYNPDGSVDFWISSEFAHGLPGALNILLSMRGMNAEHNTVYGSIDKLSFELVKNNGERTVRLTPVDDSKIEGFELIDAQIVFTEVRGYISVEYIDSTKDADMGLSLRLLDQNGKEITSGGGHCWEMENGHECWELTIQSFEEIPETMLLEVHVIGENILGQIECKVEEITG